MDKLRIILTGDSGLLGSNLAYLWRDKYDIIGISRCGKGIRGIRHISADLTCPGSVRSIFTDVKPFAVVHTAALVSIEDCEKNPGKAKIFNVTMTSDITEEAKRIGSQMVYISTDAFYQGDADELCKEDHPVTLGSVYARTKYEGEAPVFEYEKGLILRTNIYGFNLLDKVSFGEWVLRDLRGGKTLTMFTDVLFSPILVNDLALVVERSIESGLSGRFNAGGSGNISKYDFAVTLKENFGIEIGSISPTSVKDFCFRAWRSTNMSMDNSRIKKALGIDIPDAVESIHNFKSLYEIKYANRLKEASI